MNHKSFLYFFICLIAYSLTPSSVYAQESKITVSPSLISLDLSTDQPEAVLTYINSGLQTVELSLSAQDFKELEDGYKMSYLTGSDQNFTYGLSSWIDFSTKTLTLNPHESKKVTVYIQKDHLTPGGHYGSILAGISVPDTQKGTVGLQGTLSSLIFVRTNTGKETESADIKSFEATQNTVFYHFPDTMSLRFANTGDAELVPYGKITVTDIFGRIVAVGILNENSLMTLPESIRRYEVPIRIINTPLVIYIYHATLTMHYGKTHVTKVVHTTFFSEGIVPVIEACTIAIVFCIFWINAKKKRPQ